MRIKPPSKTAILESIPEEKLSPYLWDREIMTAITHKNGGIYYSGCKLDTNPAHRDEQCGFVESEDINLADTIRDGTMMRGYMDSNHAIMVLPHVTETTKDGFTVRSLRVGIGYYDYGYESENGFSIMTVRSDHELYTRLDPATPFVLLKTATHRDSSHVQWSAFAIAPFSLGLWVVDICFLMNPGLATKAMKTYFKDNLVDGLFATEEMLVELEAMAPESLVEALFEKRAEYNEDSMRLQANKVASEFFYGDVEKIRLGIWKVSRGEHNFKQRDHLVSATFNNGHSNLQIELKNSQAGDVMAINNLDELGLIRKLIPVPRIQTVIPEEVEAINQGYRDINIRINGISVPITVKSRRYFIFGYAVKNDEVHELIQGLCCMNNAEDMTEISKDVSLLSLKYRQFLSDGITCTGTFPVTANTTVPFIKRLWRDNQHQYGHEFNHDLERRKMLVQENYTFRFERRGPRGLQLVAGKDRYPVYPYDLEKTFKIRDYYYDGSAWTEGKSAFDHQVSVIRKALGFDKVDEAAARKIIWQSFKNARVAIRRSRSLLEEVSAELGAVKSVIRAENRKIDAYIVTGTSGNRYAVTDDARYRVFREVPKNDENDRWVFVCIEGKSDQSQEVDKDKLVTRMLALTNDQDSLEDISTLHAGLR